MFMWVLRHYAVSTDILVPKPLKGTDHVGGQLRRDKECPFSGITNSGSLEEGAEKRFLECDKDLIYVLRKAHIHSNP